MAAKTYRTDEEVDFVIVGSGAAGGVLARELSMAGFSVVVLEHMQTILGVVLVEDTLVEVHLTMVEITMVVVVDPITLEPTKPIQKANEKGTV